MFTKKWFTTSICILFIGGLFLFSAWFRYSNHHQYDNYVNLDASYHVLLTITALDQTSPIIHKFLPIISLGQARDKHIPWGATLPDQYGNYYYTSFPQLGFVFPYAVFKLFNCSPTLQHLFFLNLAIDLTATLLIFFLARVIYQFLSQNRGQGNVPALLTAVVYLFSLESLYSHGYVYWGHSLFQIFYLLLLLALFPLFLGKLTKKSVTLIFGICFLMCMTEWSGFTATLGTMLMLLCVRDIPLRYRWLLVFSAGLGAALALAWFIISFCITVNPHAFFKDLYARYLWRSYGSSRGTFLDLFNGYWQSYGYFLLLLPLAIISLFFQKSRPQTYRPLLLLLGVILFACLENVIMKQHAIQYCFDRLKLLPLFALALPVIWLSQKMLLRCCAVIIVLGATVIALRAYPHARKWDQSELKLNQSYLNNINFNQCLIGIDHPVRGYINLLFERGIYEFTRLSHLINIARRLNNTACVYSLDFTFAHSNSVNSFYKKYNNDIDYTNIITGVYYYNLKKPQQLLYFSTIPCSQSLNSTRQLLSCHVYKDLYLRRFRFEASVES